jgi:hypothetical protein
VSVFAGFDYAHALGATCPTLAFAALLACIALALRDRNKP